MDDKEFELEKLKLNVDVWKKVVDVQQHFNDLEMKVRNFGLLIISAFISAIGVSLKSQYSAVVFDYNVPVAAFLSFGALVVWILVFFMDVYWYHPLLIGSVKKGAEIEEQLSEQLPNINLTLTIGKESSIDIGPLKKVRSTRKAKIFYWGIAVVLAVMSVGIGFMGKHTEASDRTTNDVPKVLVAPDAKLKKVEPSQATTIQAKPTHIVPVMVEQASDQLTQTAERG
ncbi:hypothetical protein FA893_16925 [Photobacterium damselae subsp. piscicida]|nr:hypothetical protein [Photobacterium damselae]TFZ59841.1 hypothetical protein E4T25_09060 [Photobacterium damselae subsp. piscicida]TJZ84159.1 hypothetical protein FA893_16925 [Photobacterium damselae subsp. piscicida]BBC40855.1 hypothetical protein PDPE_1-01695 [Photobacterium damselae subsp. piscicida]